MAAIAAVAPTIPTWIPMEGSQQCTSITCEGLAVAQMKAGLSLRVQVVLQLCFTLCSCNTLTAQLCFTLCSCNTLTVQLCFTLCSCNTLTVQLCFTLCSSNTLTAQLCFTLCSVVDTMRAGETKTFQCEQPMLGRYVTVYIPRHEYLHLCEVE
ncbi:hypothetical protein JZ751_016196, partial [Albula glossodonta]